MLQQRCAEDTGAFGSFPGDASIPLIGKLRKAEMSLVRVGFGRRDYGHLHVDMGRQDAFYVIVQLCDHPAHEYWTDGRPAPAPVSPRGSVHIADLNEAPSALLVDPFDSLNMFIPRAFLKELAEDVGAGPVSALAVPQPWTTEDPVLSELSPALVAALSDQIACGPLFADRLVTSMALHVAERYGGMGGRAVALPGRLAPWQERRARDMLAANLAKDVTLADIATECGLSVAHFSRAFKASVGTTPHAWLQGRRLDRSMELLTRAELSLAEIAIQCGFADQSHFTRAFSAVEQVSPGMWRRSHVASDCA